jgi:hypothetical protein
MEETMFVPSDKVGLFPVRMNVVENNGSSAMVFEFHDFVEIPSGGTTFAGAFRFVTSDVSGVSTSNLSQRLGADALEPADPPIPASSDNAVLSTVSNPDAPPTSALDVQTVDLELDGFPIGEWEVQFETPVHEFRLDGSWRKV